MCNTVEARSGKPLKVSIDGDRDEFNLIDACRTGKIQKSELDKIKELVSGADSIDNYSKRPAYGRCENCYVVVLNGFQIVVKEYSDNYTIMDLRSKQRTNAIIAHSTSKAS